MAGLPCQCIERTGFKQHVCLRAFDPLADVREACIPLGKCPLSAAIGFMPSGSAIQPMRREATPVSRQRTSYFAAQFRLFGNKQPQKRAPHVAEPNDGEVVGRNGNTP